MEPNRKLFPDHLPFILHGVLVATGSLTFGPAKDHGTFHCTTYINRNPAISAFYLLNIPLTRKKEKTKIMLYDGDRSKSSDMCYLSAKHSPVRKKEKKEDYMVLPPYHEQGEIHSPRKPKKKKKKEYIWYSPPTMTRGNAQLSRSQLMKEISVEVVIHNYIHNHLATIQTIQDGKREKKNNH
jgi:hypothetical protein